MQLHGKRKLSDSPPSAIPTHLSERIHNNSENSPSLMRFIRNLFRPSWEIEDDDGGEDARKRQKTSDTPLAARTHTKEVHQRRRRHKRTNSLSSISQLSSQAVLPAAKRLEFGVSGRQEDLLAHLPEEPIEPVHQQTKSTTEHVGAGADSSRSAPLTRRAATTTRARQPAADGLSQNGDNADGPYAAGTSNTPGKRPVPVEGGSATLEAAAVVKRIKKMDRSAPRPHRQAIQREELQDHPGDQHLVRLTAPQGKTPLATTAVVEEEEEEEQQQRQQEEEPGEETEGADLQQDNRNVGHERAAAAIITSVAPPDTETVEYTYAEVFDSCEYIRQLLPRAAVVHPQRILLPPLKRRKPTLVLDLDETLVHSTIEPPPPGSPPPDHVFSVTLENITYNVFVRVRPNMHQFLAEVAKQFELVVFTASQEAYAGRLLDMLDTDRHISHRLYRDACVFVEGNFVKDLDMLGRDLQRTTIVDNSPLAFAYHLDNGIPIESWFGERSDNHLMALVPFLRELARADDVRPLIRKKYAAQHRYY